MENYSPPLTIYISPRHEMPTTPATTFYCAYVIVIGNNRFITGFKHDLYDKLMSKDEFEYIDFDSFLTWEQIPFHAIRHICQLDLVNKMEDKFPWNKSKWKSKEIFDEKYQPQTLKGKINKSIISSKYFSKYFYNTTAWNNAISNKWHYQTSTNGYGPVNETLVEIQCNYYIIKEGINQKQHPWATIQILSHQEANTILEKIKAHEISKYSLYKQYGKKCRTLSKKYGIRFDIALFVFKGNEEKIKNFTISLKEALDKPYNAHELICGRKRRHAEIKRLGIKISNINPDSIAPYILQCFEAKKILK